MQVAGRGPRRRGRTVAATRRPGGLRRRNRAAPLHRGELLGHGQLLAGLHLHGDLLPLVAAQHEGDGDRLAGQDVRHAHRCPEQLAHPRDLHERPRRIAVDRE